MSNDTTNGTEHHLHHGEGHHHGGYSRSAGWILTLCTALVVTAVGFVGVDLGHARHAVTSTITVTGSGTVQGTPDTINFQIGVATVNPTATAALSENDTKVRALEAALLKNGVTKKEMQTSGLNIYDNTNNQGVVTGFTVQDTLNVTMHKVLRAGTAIDAAARAAGNGVQLDGVSFTITNDSSLLRAARIRAMDNAHLAAGQLATAGNRRSEDHGQREPELGHLLPVVRRRRVTQVVGADPNWQSARQRASDRRLLTDQLGPHVSRPTRERPPVPDGGVADRSLNDERRI